MRSRVQRQPKETGFAACAFGLMFALPRIFFRKDGTLNLRWWLTAAPFGLSMWMLILGVAGVIDPAIAPESLAFMSRME